ncbi:MAG: bifunctional 5,10-methylenetetrahydrofolate dehydrogenase/5,10-methenyltetrahydrofolate cyclohydrolase [Dehalococcoidia bacterium]|nr:MAG: bifunctional 5,10-methylenetetrahydrofolate dehydrogenase/5,10-methenyltetrahydrofolate cyclohydrolase [Dehalococcoidia bacterium]
MSAIILDGKLKANEIKRNLRQEIGRLKALSGRIPRLAALQVGDETSFSVYVNSQKKAAYEIGIDYRLVKLPSDCTEKCLLDNILSLNNDKGVSGIILQSPLPAAFDIVKISSFISSNKDVEGVNPENKGKLLLNSYKVVPPTASAVMELIGLSGISLKGREAVIIGHSGIVGKPIAMLLLDKLCTVTVCHIETHKRGNLLEHIKRAEVLIASAGKPNLVKGEWIRENAVVIDVGINRVEDKIVGDVEFGKALLRASYISPVPGGVGPLTTTILMRNCVELFKNQGNTG